MEFADPSGAAGPPSAALRSRVARRLLTWFESARRDLPWRRDRDAYRVWVSEVMLQQTTVTAVVPYFERFLTAFPTVAALAAADEQEVLRLWEGLGYYRRARDLHRAARRLADEHNGSFPDDPDALVGYPGLGRYTRNAVLSQAFDRRLPILEANSLRVLCRLFGRIDDPRRGPAQRWLWQTAEDLLPANRAGDFNQALMELGALVCTPTTPACAACPLASDCVARRLNLQETIPARAARPTITEVSEAAVVVRRGTDVLLTRRPATGRWPRMWEFPHGPLTDGETAEDAARRLARDLAGVAVVLGGEVMTLRHSVTRYRIALVCFEATHAEGEFRSSFYEEGLWVAPERLGDYPVSAPQRRLARALTAPDRQPRLF